MMSLSVATQHAQGMLEKGELADANAANVAIIRMMGVRIITNRIPKDVRAALYAAVKAGQLGRLPKDGLLPEAFFHPNGRANALDARARVARESIEAIKRVLV